MRNGAGESPKDLALESVDPTTASRIRQSYDRLSSGQRRFAALVLDEPTTVAVTSAAKVGEQLRISSSTAVRAAMALGFDGYPALQRSLQAALFQNLTTVNRLQATRHDFRVNDVIAVMRDTLERDAKYVANVTRLTSPDEFDACVREINGARRVYVVGMWISHTAAYLLSLGLRDIGIDGRLIGLGAGDLGDDLQGADRRDALVAVSLRRYPRKTVAALDVARSLGLRRIAITDDPLGALAVHADHAMFVDGGEDRFIQSITAMVSLVNAVVTAAAVARPERSRRSLAALERAWEISDAYSTGRESHSAPDGGRTRGVDPQRGTIPSRPRPR